MQQQKHPEWAWQWQHFQDDNQWLFADWIYPNTLETFRGKRVLDCGCGGGQHVSFIAPVAAHVTGLDLNATAQALERTKEFPNVTIREADLMDADIGEQFDVSYSIGVLHHTDDPDRTFQTLVKHTAPGGRVIVWVYSHEGNWLNRVVLEGAKRAALLKLPRPAMRVLAHILTALVYIPVYTIYLLPLTFLPYYEYFRNWRKLSYERNLLNVFDKLNAPQTIFITRERVERWFDPAVFSDIHISPYRGVSWRGSGTKR